MFPTRRKINKNPTINTIRLKAVEGMLVNNIVEGLREGFLSSIVDITLVLDAGTALVN